MRRVGRGGGQNAAIAGKVCRASWHWNNGNHRHDPVTGSSRRDLREPNSSRGRLRRRGVFSWERSHVSTEYYCDYLGYVQRRHFCRTAVSPPSSQTSAGACQMGHSRRCKTFGQIAAGFAAFARLIMLSGDDRVAAPPRCMSARRELQTQITAIAAF